MENHSRWIAAQNIERFNQKLQAETEPAKRAILQQLLHKEKQKLEDR